MGRCKAVALLPLQLLALAPLARDVTATGAALSAASASALAADDACAPDRESGAACAVEALQVSQQRRTKEALAQGQIPSQEDFEAYEQKVDTLRRQVHLLLSLKHADEDTKRKADEALDKMDDAIEGAKALFDAWYPDRRADRITPWVLPSYRMMDMWGIPAPLQPLVEPFGNYTTPMATEFPYCREYPAYLWPAMSFWARQINRRLDMVALGDEENLQRVWHFARQASFLANVLMFDPREGSPYAEYTQPFFREVAASDSLDMPPFPEFFRRTSNMDAMWATDVSMWWFQNLACDIAWWARDLQGDMVGDKEVCWDKVPAPSWGYTSFGISYIKDREPWPADHPEHPLDYPEYLQCQQYSLNETLFSGICPFGGHLENGTFGVSWGNGVPTPEGREEVLKCQAKMGPLQYNRMDMSKTYFPWTKGIDLGEMVVDGYPKKSNASFSYDAYLEDMKLISELSSNKEVDKMKQEAQVQHKAEPAEKATKQ